MTITSLSSQINVVASGPVLSVKFKRPDKMNAFTFEMYRSLTEILNKAEKSDGVRVVVLSGMGEHFSAGNDIADFVSVLEEGGMARDSDAAIFVDTIREFSKPIIAAVDGYAVGIGTTLLLYCDLVYASSMAKFRTPFTHLGLCPEAAASHIMPKMMGRARAGEWLLLGDVISSEQAMRDGIITRIVDDPIGMAMDKAKFLAGLSPKALQDTKKLMSSNNEVLRNAFDQEMIKFAECLESDEAKQAFKQFLEKQES
ncbi:enoyl-CoA hydratase-related protein [Pseudemcibacter aquimaris]|uniref:enoyl-CoA hydratase-related protein n=1 Tax=Pseudemcibacter aquimaris TaxID=2857064 RepID=UPI00201249E9|nr:enoyl-CoA hydratase-related protein [Pseudemcibacter aquimaris]MCC3862307.1 enoyl-CoA hydratase/isomerase family protein [Pseudemcibacter aquimaris]WDU59055.1 enoyl-CoA hydratase/isomerase family protein [Pseudemcibacter aquimaris]